VLFRSWVVVMVGVRFLRWVSVGAEAAWVKVRVTVMVRIWVKVEDRVVFEAL